VGTESFGRLNTAEWEQLEDLADRFQEAWKPDQPVDLQPFLPPPGSPLRSITLRELVITDLELRWRHGQRVGVEDYYQKYPELPRSRTVLIKLLFEEYRIRHRYGDEPDLSVYQRRFPEVSEDLRRLLQRSDTLYATPVQGAPATGGPRPPSGVGVDRTLAVAGSYRLVERMGSGAFGEVWRAEAPGGFPAAIKVIFRPVDHEEAQRELASLELMRGLRHRCLVQTQAFWSQEERLYIVMELADGSLRGRLAEFRKAGQEGIPPDELLTYFRDTAEALDYLHQEHVLHRDIKPENILLVQGHAKVADFGLARLHGSRRLSIATGAGTPMYMAPEVFRGQVSTQTDQYSLAMTYAELRLGRRVLHGQNLMELMLEHIQGKPDLSPLPQAEQRVILKGLSKEPDDRAPSCLAWFQELEEALVDKTRVPVPPPPRPRLRARLLGLLLSVSLALALAVPAGFLAAWMHRSATPPPPPSDHSPVAAGTFKVDDPHPLFLHRGETGTIRLHLQRSDFPDAIKLDFPNTESDHLRLSQEAPAGVDQGDDLAVDVTADAQAKVGATRHLQITASGGRQEVRVPIDVTVLYLPPGNATGTEPQDPQDRDVNEKLFHPRVTWKSAGGTPVDFVLIPKRPGEEGPDSYYMMVDKVSVRLFGEFAKTKYPDWRPPAQDGNENEDYPVFNVSWEQARQFAEWLGGELPDTAEWDKAAGFRAWDESKDTGPFVGRWSGDHRPDIAVAMKKARPLGAAKHDRSEPYGCRDMAGNGAEWTRTRKRAQSNLIELRGRSFRSPQPFLFKFLEPPPLGGNLQVQNADQGEDDTGFRVVLKPR
jgi:serine/threonine protein kinase